MARGSRWVLAVSLLAGWVVAPALAQPTATDQAIRFFQARLSRDPEDLLSLTKLGEAYLQKMRETGDVTYVTLAEKTLQRTLELGPDPLTAASATTQLALVAHTKHEFQDALAYARRALDYGAGRPTPYALIGDAYVELGEYEKADAAYARLLSLRGPAYPYARLAHLRFLRGDPQGAIQEMRRGVEALRDGSLSAENVAWAQSQLGELHFQVGDLPKAETAYREALTTYPGYHRALAGLARVRAAQKREAEAIEFYHKALGVIPLPEYATALGDVYTKLGRTQDARKQYDLVELIGALNALNQSIYNRELALFYADHDLKLTAALALAERELTVRRDIYTYDVLAWTLYRNGRPREALGAMAEALKLGTRDARLFFHAGMIHAALGDVPKAREYLTRALAINPHFHLLQGDVARAALRALESRPAAR